MSDPPALIDKTNLAEKASTVVGWSAVAQALSQLIQLLTLAILARLLVPDDFGLLGMATVISGFVITFHQLGLNQAIIQRKELLPSHLSTSFWGSLFVSVVITGLIIALAPLISSLFNDMRVASVLRVTSLGLVLGSLPMTHNALLQRKLRFKEIGIILVVSVVISSLISITMAFRGWGVWSLVVGQLTVGPVTFLLAHFYEPWRVNKVFSFKAFKELISYGGHISAGNVINYASVNLDNLIIGRYLGSQTLGIYSLAYKIMQTPLRLLSRVVPQALFPVFSGIQDDERSLVRGYLRSTHYVVLVMFPMMAGCIVLAPEIISVLFGEKWLEAIPLVQILCIAGAMKSAGMNIAIVFKAKGRPDVTWKWNLFILFLYIPLFFGVIRWGSSGIAVVISGLSIPLLLLWQLWLTRIIKVSWGQYWRSLKQPFVASVVMAGIILAIKEFRFIKDLEPLVIMLIFICLGALIYCVMILLFDRSTVTEISTILKSRNAWIKRSF